MYSYKYKNGYLIYDRNKNKIFFSTKLTTDINKMFLEKSKQNIEPYVKNKDKHEMEQVQITFISTPSCNLNCKYCYEHNKLSSSGFITMTAEQHYKIYESIQNYYPKCKIKICFFGGEPFLAKQSIFKFIERLKSDCEIKKVPFPKLAVITNGTLLNADVRKFIYDYINEITFSLDGIKVLHNSNRLYIDGNGSFDDVIGNIQKLNELNSNEKISTACEVTLTDAYLQNYDHNLMSKVWNLMKNLKFNIVEFITVIDDKSQFINKPENLDIIAKDLVDLWYDDILNNDINFNVPSLFNYLSLLIGNKSNENIICGAGHSYFAVGSTNNVYPCQVSAFEDNNVIGKISDSNLILNTNKHEAYVKKSQHPMCKMCECLKGCNSFCKISMRNARNKFPTSCIFNQRLFKYSLLKIVNIMDSNEKYKFIENIKKFSKTIAYMYERQA